MGLNQFILIYIGNIFMYRLYFPKVLSNLNGEIGKIYTCRVWLKYPSI